MRKLNLNKIVDQTTDKCRKVRSLWKFAHQFRKDDDGAMVILALFIFIFMLAMGGIGIDTMRHEMERAHLHAVLDNAVLAGAAAPDGRDPKAIVTDYFAKSDMSEYLHPIKDSDVVSSMNATMVTARASMTIDTYLMKLSGVNTLSAATAATAERRVPKLEIVLVLDVSGSMRNNSKIQNLRIAAKDFVTTIMNASTPGDTVISIVPFSTSVTPTDGLFDALAVNKTHDYSNCIYLEASDYLDPSLPTKQSFLVDNKEMDQSIYTSRYDVNGAFNKLNADWRSCYTDTYFQIMPYSISETQLNAKIESLEAAGNTSTDQGVKWGSALLGPGFRDVSAALIDNEEIHESLARVPVDYDEPETLKIMIVMGDGENTTTYFFDRGTGVPYRGPNSDLFRHKLVTQVFDYAYRKRNVDRKYYGASNEWRCSDTRRYACEYKTEARDVYFLRDPNPINHDGDSAAENFYNIGENEWLEQSEYNLIADPDLNPDLLEDPVQLSWEEAWGLMTPDYYGSKTSEWGAQSDYVDSEFISGSTKNSRMGDICTTLKNEGTFIYSIGFEIPAGGTAETNLLGCASSVEHYYRAQGLSITDAFSSIASNVQNLRLTQ